MLQQTFHKANGHAAIEYGAVLALLALTGVGLTPLLGNIKGTTNQMAGTHLSFTGPNNSFLGTLAPQGANAGNGTPTAFAGATPSSYTLTSTPSVAANYAASANAFASYCQANPTATICDTSYVETVANQGAGSLYPQIQALLTQLNTALNNLPPNVADPAFSSLIASLSNSGNSLGNVIGALEAGLPTTLGSVNSNTAASAATSATSAQTQLQNDLNTLHVGANVLSDDYYHTIVPDQAAITADNDAITADQAAYDAAKAVEDADWTQHVNDIASTLAALDQLNADTAAGADQATLDADTLAYSGCLSTQSADDTTRFSDVSPMNAAQWQLQDDQQKLTADTQKLQQDNTAYQNDLKDAQTLKADEDAATAADTQLDKVINPSSVTNGAAAAQTAAQYAASLAQFEQELLAFVTYVQSHPTVAALIGPANLHAIENLATEIHCIALAEANNPQWAGILPPPPAGTGAAVANGANAIHQDADGICWAGTGASAVQHACP